MSSLVKAIRTGLLTRLQGINGVSPYSTLPKIVTQQRQAVEKYGSYPVLCLRPDEGDSDDQGNPLRTMTRHAFWDVYVFVKDDTDLPDQVFDVMADVTKAVESDQTLGGLGYIAGRAGRAVVVTGWESWEVAGEVSRGFQAARVLVRTTYLTAEGEI